MERALCFGPDDALVGVLNAPDDARADAPLVLLTNSGVIPRQGPHRMNVRIARALAANGIASLRFDQAGHGDSRPIANPAGVRDQAVRDFKSAMDRAARETGASRFLIFGVCSGAVNAYDVALADERVAGIMMFDGFWYKSFWTNAVLKYKRAANADWSRRYAAIVRRLVRLVTRDDGSRRSSADARNERVADDAAFGNPPITVFVDAIQRLVDRSTSVYFVYGGSVLDFYSYAGQFRDVFGGYPFHARIRCEFHPDIDHTFISRYSQDRMIGLVSAWAVKPEPPA